MKTFTIKYLPVQWTKLVPGLDIKEIQALDLKDAYNKFKNTTTYSVLSSIEDDVDEEFWHISMGSKMLK